MKLHTKILIGLIAGAVVGIGANLSGSEDIVDIVRQVEPIGTAFIRLITMIVIPLVVASLMVGAASLGDLASLGRIGGRTVAFYLSTTAMAVTIGIVLSNVVSPGKRVSEEARTELLAEYGGDAESRIQLADEAPGLIDVLMEMIPRNPVEAAANGEMLPIIFFTLLFGAAAAGLSEDKKRPMLEFFDSVNEISMKIIHWIMLLAPYAVFALIAAITARFGLGILRSLLVYCVVVVAGLLLHALVTYGLILRLAVKAKPGKFFYKIREAQILAFSTSSSNATLPVSISVAQSNLGISNKVSSFVLPLGATINMDGTALYQGVAVMFIAQVFGIDLSIPAQLTVVLTATLASIGAAGVPSAGIITLALVLRQAGVPETGIALVLGVDRILDMCRTAVNVTGDLTATAFIARTEGEDLDQEVSAGSAPATAA